MTNSEAWSHAFARQASADFDTWNVLEQDLAIPACHKLLFLQMACEKLAKAHLCSKRSDPVDLQSSHGYTAKNLPAIIRDQLVKARKNPNDSAWVLKHARYLAQEIELLAPAVKRGGQRPDNCEYPWEDSSGRLHVPLDWTFRPSSLLSEPAGRTFLKIVRLAIRELSGDK